ncbi:MAG TPA: TIGR02466 family protein [Sphingomonas sp.]
MPSRKLFATLFYEGQLDDDALLAELDDACRSVAEADTAGQDWSAEHGYGGYTSYASLNDLPQRDPRFGDLVRRLDKHVAAFAGDCAFDLGGKRLKLDSLWINLLEPGGAHSGHIHPHSVISGTIYVAVPPGSGPLKLEDPRLPLMMAAPPRRAESGEDHASFVYAAPRAGTIFLWESWLRHEVPASAADDFRISISFNYRW